MRAPAAVGLGLLALACVRCAAAAAMAAASPRPPAIAATKARTIAVAAKKTKGTGTYRFALDTSMSVSDQKVDTHAEGVVDEDRGLASMTLDTAGAGGLMQSIEGGTTIYMKSPPVRRRQEVGEARSQEDRHPVGRQHRPAEPVDHRSERLPHVSPRRRPRRGGRARHGARRRHDALQGRDRPAERGEGQAGCGARRDRQVHGPRPASTRCRTRRGSTIMVSCAGSRFT